MSKKKTAEYIFTGKPCKRGHVGPRYKNGNCVECLLLREREKQTDPEFVEAKRKRELARYHANLEDSREKVRLSRERNRESINKARRGKYEADPEVLKAEAARWRAENPEKLKESRRKYHTANRDQRLAMSKTYRCQNLERMREASRAHSRKDFEKRPHYYNEKRSARRAGLLTATPSWANRQKMREVYQLARVQSLESGVRMSVDHIVPLRGEVNGEWVVCGLHCEANLQIMSLVKNKSKGNRHWPNMPNEG